MHWVLWLYKYFVHFWIIGSIGKTLKIGLISYLIFCSSRCIFGVVFFTMRKRKQFWYSDADTYFYILDTLKKTVSQYLSISGRQLNTNKTMGNSVNCCALQSGTGASPGDIRDRSRSKSICYTSPYALMDMDR